jgi:hypothetical protein
VLAGAAGGVTCAWAEAQIAAENDNPSKDKASRMGGSSCES